MAYLIHKARQHLAGTPPTTFSASRWLDLLRSSEISWSPPTPHGVFSLNVCVADVRPRRQMTEIAEFVTLGLHHGSDQGARCCDRDVIVGAAHVVDRIAA